MGRFGAGVCLLVFGTAAWGGDGPRAVVPVPVQDFGVVDRGVPVEHRFRVENAGDTLLRLEQVKSSCACSVVLATGREVAPGGAAEVSVRLDTTRLAGRVTKTVTVYTNDPEGSVLGLTLTGNVEADLLVSPTPLYFGAVRRGQATRRELVVTPGRPGATPAITWIENTNPAVRTTLEPPTSAGQRVVVDVDPHLPQGRFNDQLVLHTTSAREPVLSVPVFGSIEGDVLIAPPQVTFGVTASTEPAERALLVRSRGERSLRIVGVSVPKDVVEYDIETLEEGREYRVRLRLRPDLSPGTIEGRIDIFTNLPDEEHLTVPLYAIIRRG